MSEFLAEARILVRPDTSQFRRDLELQLESVVRRPIQIPVVPIVSASGAAAAAASAAAASGAAAFAASQQNLAEATAITSDALATATTIERQYAGAVDLSTVSVQAQAAAQEKAAVTTAAAAAAQTRQLGQLERGAGASLLTLLGLRGATLAASGAFLAGTAAVVGFAKAVQSAAALETELNVFRVTAEATADEMKRVSDEAKQLGRDLTLPGVTANDAAVAMTELAKAGLSVRDAMAAARGTLQLATAAQIDNATAAQLVSSALNSFELDGSKAVHVADLFAGAAANAQGSIQDFGPALAQASAVAHGFGISIDDTVTLLTQLAKAGLEGGRAGTSLRVALLRLVKPPADAAKALHDLNIQVRDLSTGNVRPQVFTDIEKALQGVSKAQRQATEATIFGSDAVRTQILLGQQGAAAFNRTKAAVTEAGLAQEQAAARTQGLQGDFENLSNQVSTLGLTIGEVAKGPTSELVKSLANIVSQANTAAEGMVTLVGDVKDVGGAVAGAIPFVDKLGISFGNIAKVSNFLNPLTLQLGFVSETMKKFGLTSEDSGKKLGVFGAIADSVTASLKGVTDALGEAAAGFKAQQPQLDTGLNVKQVQNILGGFDAKTVRDKINHDNTQLLADLQTEQNFLIAQLQRQYVKNRPALKRALEQTLLGVVNEIDSINQKAQSASKTAKDKAEKAARDAAAAVTKREQALLASQGLARDQRQNKIDQAAQTKTLEDDIAQENKLKALVLRQIEQVKERISIEGGRAAAIAALRRILIQINATNAQLVEEQNAARQQQRQDLLTGIGLDISLDQIQKNQVKEVADRKRLIAQLNKDLAAEAKLHGRTTVAYKEIRNQIAEQNAAIAAINQEKKKSSLGIAEFEFLQAQQGFASNLLGNLIPSGATAGLVGGATRTPVQAALTPVAGAAEGQAKSGPTSGQAQTTNAILLRILDQLKIVNGHAAAPEARQWWSWQNAVMDGVGGG